MTLGGRLVSLFPLMYLLLVMAWAWKMFASFHHFDPLVLIGIVYLLPLLLHRIHFFFFPFDEGFWVLAEKKYNPWWASHMFQYPFIALPFLESLLHFIPGLFSLWLRAWGSKIGKNVFWTPRVEVIDRNLVEIGDHCVFGHLVVMVFHMVAEIDGKSCLVLKKVKVGDRCFVGADSQFGPGAEIADKTIIKVKTRLFWRGEWK